jgi:BON domain
MEMSATGKLESASTSRRAAIRRRSWLMSGAAVLMTLSLVTGCKSKQQASQAAPPSDQQITSAIQAKIQGESALSGQSIQVSVQNGVATLSGTVTDDASRALAGNDSGTVDGVKTVVNNLTVQPEQQAAAAPAPAPTPAKEPEREHRRDYRRHEDSHQASAHDRNRDRDNVPPPSQEASVAPPPPVQNVVPVQPAPPPPPKPVARRVTIPAGTVIPVILTEGLDSKTAQPNDAFHATLASNVMADGMVAIPRGSPVLGQVLDAKEAAHFKGQSLLSVDLTEVRVYGRRIDLQTDAFTKEGKARGRNTAEKTGGGAVLGAIIGAIAGGGKGAAIGAAAGAGAGTGVNAVTRGEEVQIASESRIDFHLQAPVTLTVSSNPPPMEQSNEPQLQHR